MFLLRRVDALNRLTVGFLCAFIEFVPSEQIAEFDQCVGAFRSRLRKVAEQTKSLLLLFLAMKDLRFSDFSSIAER